MLEIIKISELYTLFSVTFCISHSFCLFIILLSQLEQKLSEVKINKQECVLTRKGHGNGVKAYIFKAKAPCWPWSVRTSKPKNVQKVKSNFAILGMVLLETRFSLSNYFSLVRETLGPWSTNSGYSL